MLNNTKSKTKPSLISVYLVIFFGFLGYSLSITVFTPMLLGHNAFFHDNTFLYNHRSLILGFLLCLYPLGQFISSPVLGALSDQYGRKPVLAVSLILSIIFYVLIIISLINYNLWLLMLACFLCGLSEANIAIAQGAIADVSDDKNRAKLFGYIYLFASCAYIIGPLFGGKLADSNINNNFSFFTPFMIVAILLVFNFLLVIFCFTETKLNKDKHTRLFLAFTNLLNIFKPSKIRRLYFINFLIYFSIFGFFRSYPMYMVDTFNMQVSKLSEFIAWVAVPIVLSNLFLMGFLSKHIKPKSLVIISVILMGILMFIIILPKFESALWITLFLTALPLAICLPACSTFLSLLVNSQNQGKVMGNNQSIQVGAESISGLAAGALASINFSAPLIVLSIIAVIAGIILFLSNSKM